MKRRLPASAQDHRPRRMVVPSTEEQVKSRGNAYEWDCDEILQQIGGRIRRPFPTSTVLASLPSTSTRRGLAMPLLKDLQPLFKKTPASEEKDNDEEKVVERIDDSKLSTLTKGQHARYLQCIQSGAKRQEFHKLAMRVQEEQERYRQALEEFWINHAQRFKVGLDSPFGRVSSLEAKHYQSQWQRPLHYGKCRQVLSLQHVSREAICNRSSRKPKVSVDRISSRVVGEKEHGTTPPSVDDWQHCLAPVLDKNNIPKPQFLHDDQVIQLAKDHGVSIVTTEETLQTLLQLPNESHWMIPSTCASGVVVLDLPIPQATSTPRDCVTHGATEGLYQGLSGVETLSYSYSLLELPGKKTIKVLVRCRHRLQDAEQHPLNIHAHLEYFPERGWEQIPAYPRALWILDKKLQEDTRILLARVCPERMNVLQWEEMGIAHALSGSDDQVDPMHHWEALVEMLQATETLPEGQHVLVLTPTATSVSVHSACEKADDAAAAVDIGQVLEKADQVYAGAVALRQCARVWQWKEDKIPYTFPIPKEKDGKLPSK